MENLYPTPHELQSQDLTWREQEVLSLLAKRLSNKEISAKLHLSVSTVKWYNHQIFAKLGVRDPHQNPVQVDPKNPPPGYFEYDGEQYVALSSGHIMGTYLMGRSKSGSVVDKFQRSWDHQNLFLVGSGVFPSCGTSNPTLTIAALSFWAADTIKADLDGME